MPLDRMSSLKERGRVKQAGMEWGAGFRRLRACRAGPRASLGPGVPCFPIAAVPVSGRTGSRTGRSRPAEPAPQASLRPGPRPESGGGGRRGVCGCGVRAPWAAPVRAGAWLRSSLPGSSRLAAAGHGAVRAGSGINPGHGHAARAGARPGGDHALPAAGPAHGPVLRSGRPGTGRVRRAGRRRRRRVAAGPRRAWRCCGPGCRGGR